MTGLFNFIKIGATILAVCRAVILVKKADMIEKLPLEILRVILGCVLNSSPYSCQQQQSSASSRYSRTSILHSLCLTSKYLHSVVEPLLYEKFSTRFGLSYQWWAYSIVTTPRLAGYVREIDLNLKCPDSAGDSLRDNVHNAFFLELAREYGWAHQAERSLDLWMITFLLSHTLSNLDKAMIHASFLTESEATVFATLNFPSISELRIDYNCASVVTRPLCPVAVEAGGIDIYYLLRVLSLGKLEKLHIYGFHTCAAWEQRIPMNTSIKHLRLSRSCFEPENLGRLLSLLPNLMQLDYDQGPCQVLGSSGPEIVNVLTLLHNQFKSLHLDLSQRRTYQGSEVAFVSSFKTFANLEHLSIDSHSIQREHFERHADDNDDDLFDFSESSSVSMVPETDDLFKGYFPENLKSLRITHAYHNLAKSLTELSANIRSWLPKLKEIQIDFEPHVPSTREYAYMRAVIDRRWILPILMVRSKTPIIYFFDKHGNGVYVPASQYPEARKNPDGSEWKSVDQFISEHITIRDLPAEWQIIINNFTTAGVRVKLSSSASIPFSAAAKQAQPFEGWIASQKAAPVVEFGGGE